MVAALTLTIDATEKLVHAITSISVKYLLAITVQHLQLLLNIVHQQTFVQHNFQLILLHLVCLILQGCEL